MQNLIQKQILLLKEHWSFKMNPYKILILLLFTLTTLLGNLKLSIPSNTIIKNEPFIFVLEAYGNDIKFSNIDLINGDVVQEIASSTATNIINGQITKRVKKTYSFNPTKDFTLPSFEAVIDGKSYHTNEEKITLQKVSKTQSNFFDFTIKTESKEYYMGENFILTMVFKYRKDSQLENLYLEKPNFENFWYKQLDDSKNFEDGDYIVSEVKFLMFALKEGTLNIEPIKINAQIMENNSYSIFSTTRNKSIYSNELSFNIKTLPQNIKLIGDFQIEASIDKEKVKMGEAISYKLKIKGSGNIDDVRDIKLPINDVTIYENKPVIKTQIINNQYSGEYEKVFSIIANKSFSIPSISLEYFDKDLKKVITKQTKSFHIEVLNEELKKEVLLEKAPAFTPIETVKEESTKEIIKVVEKSSLLDKIIFFALGVITCLLIISLYFYVITTRRKKDEESKPLLKKVKNAKSKDELIKLLAVYLKIDSRLDKLIFDLEKTQDINNLKKDIVKIVKELKL
jgi:hypothetical protein